MTDKFNQAMQANVMRERMKGLQTKIRIFKHRHGEWVTVREAAQALKCHHSTTTRELKNLALAGLMEVAKQGRTYIYRAIKPIDTEITLDMFLTGAEIDGLVFEVNNVFDGPLHQDHSWMPPIVRSWGGYRVAA